MARNGAQTGADLRRKRTEECAYALWESEGRVHGRHLDHWLQAEAETTVPTDMGLMPNTRKQSEAPDGAQKKVRSRKC